MKQSDGRIFLRFIMMAWWFGCESTTIDGFFILFCFWRTRWIRIHLYFQYALHKKTFCWTISHSKYRLLSLFIPLRKHIVRLVLRTVSKYFYTTNIKTVGKLQRIRNSDGRSYRQRPIPIEKINTTNKQQRTGTCTSTCNLQFLYLYLYIHKYK